MNSKHEWIAVLTNKEAESAPKPGFTDEEINGKRTT